MDQTWDLLEELNGNHPSLSDNCYHIIERTQPFSDGQEEELKKYCEFLYESQLIFVEPSAGINWVDICFYYNRTLGDYLKQEK